MTKRSEISGHEIPFIVEGGYLPELAYREPEVLSCCPIRVEDTEGLAVDQVNLAVYAVKNA
ncbi:MAG: hypothetical protein ACHQ6U_04245 [Thermodesulfobacteriota bacterium]